MCKKATRWLLPLLLLTLAVMMAATAQAEPDVKIILENTSFTLNVGDAINVPISLQLPLGVTDTAMAYASADTGVAVAKDTTGGMRIVAMGVGETTCTATHVATGAKVTCTVKVQSVTSIKLNVYNVTLTVGGSIQLHATVSPTIRHISGYLTSDSTICTAVWDGSSDATVTAVKAGTALIYAMADDGTQTACQVTVIDSSAPVTPPPTTQPPTTPPPTTQPPVTEKPAGLPVYVKTASGSLNMRTGPGKQYLILRTIPRFASFTCLEYGVEWCKARYNGTVGYVMTEFVGFDGVDPTTPTTVTPTATPNPGTVQFQARVSTASGSLNMRTAPNQSADRIRLIPRNAIVDVLQFTSSWSYVRYNGSQGYVMTKFLSLDTNSTDGPSPGVTKYGQVSTPSGGLNLRKTASSGGKRLLIIPRNAIVEVLSLSSKWCYVSYNGVKGYVMTQYLKLI